jgi:hypothetical protein
MRALARRSFSEGVPRGEAPRIRLGLGRHYHFCAPSCLERHEGEQTGAPSAPGQRESEQARTASRPKCRDGDQASAAFGPEALCQGDDHTTVGGAPSNALRFMTPQPPFPVMACTVPTQDHQAFSWR